ncbi:enoyl-CoA hydratase/isomerase family protein [Herbaspirillum sp. SJZ107]|uniref:enoyl-CoA hydratase/isomerase family protein n=1 Tax=Herbaspirillum sp. SJZ107 TaxID=2572881 RepID=UPI0011531FC1|nr:enoyl-CoA hydratase/isomerase family protein [Herbaspirillum sp. SJZ107]TQK05457.1 methylglutaconyl-CoA hydratase [Herbaspirillum sp. SJZ107]
MDTYETLEITVADRVATITLNRPQLRNAFNENAITDLTMAFDEASQDKDVRAIVLAANGPAFCAGADLNWMKKMAGYSAAENEADALRLADMLRTIYYSPKPVVARVQGDCYAGGMGLVAACDIVVVAEGVSFCLSEVKLGLIPATISPYVIKAMGDQAARRYFLSAERFDAREAHRLGLAHEVVPAAQLDAKVGEIVKALVGNSPNAVREAKALVRDIAGLPIDDVLLADTAGRIAAIRASDEGREGVAAFLEKRKPSWLT